MDKCPHCGKEIYEKFTSKNLLLSQEHIDTINRELGIGSSGYCHSCGYILLDKVGEKRSELDKKIKSIKKEVLEIDEKINKELVGFIKLVPVLTIDVPFGWEYSSLGFVSSQNVVGTGVVAELFSDFTDFFGAKSGSYIEKLGYGEDFCLDALRYKTLLLGGNAVIGVNMTYGQAGGDKGMLMICANGTAIKLKNLEVLKATIKTKIESLEELVSYKQITKEILEAETLDDCYRLYQNPIIAKIKNKYGTSTSHTS